MFYAWHWLAHQGFMGKMHEIHWRHHFHSFPPKNFYGDPVRSLMANSAPHSAHISLRV